MISASKEEDEAVEAFVNCPLCIVDTFCSTQGLQWY